MRILITGVCGFLGSHLCDYLLKKGHQVIGMDNLITGKMDNIAHLLGRENFEFIKQDVTGYIFGSLGTHKALGLAKEKRAKFLLASTSEVYGDPKVNPQREDYWGNVNSVGPRGVYDEAKRFAESLVMAYHRNHKMDTKIARIFNTYGPRMRGDDGRVVPNFITQALKGDDLTVYGDGSQTRSFCYVSDLVEGVYRLMFSDINEPVNLGNPDEISIFNFAKKILSLTRSKSKIAFMPLPRNDPKVRCPDISKAKRLLGWQPKVSLDEGLRQTIQWFKN